MNERNPDALTLGDSPSLDEIALNAELDLLSGDMLQACEAYVYARTPEAFERWTAINSRYVATHRKWWALAPPGHRLRQHFRSVPSEPRRSRVMSFPRRSNPTPPGYGRARALAEQRRYPPFAGAIGPDFFVLDRQATDAELELLMKGPPWPQPSRWQRFKGFCRRLFARITFHAKRR